MNNQLNTFYQRINLALQNQLPAATTEPSKLHQAMRYSVFNGGKRLRPLLVYTTGITLGAELNVLDIPACAIEMVHCYSLIHDDLPAMDDDDWRRGKPSCHKAFGEATAILAGDTLYNRACEILTQLSAEQCKNMLITLTQASGSFGMAGGQAMDLESVGQNLSAQELETMHSLKTGALIRASVRLGALGANATTEQLDILDEYAKYIGLAFQIQDDIADAEEIADNKATYVSSLGIDAAKAKLTELCDKARQQLQKLKTDTELLDTLTTTILGYCA